MFVLQALETAWAAGELGEMGLKLQFFSFEIDGLKKEGNSSFRVWLCVVLNFFVTNSLIFEFVRHLASGFICRNPSPPNSERSHLRNFQCQLFLKKGILLGP